MAGEVPVNKQGPAHPYFLVDQNGNPISVGGGTQYAEGTAYTAGSIGTMAGVVQKAADAPLSADGTRSFMQVDENGFLKVNLKAGGGAGGTSQTDESSFVEGASPFTPMGGVRNDTITSDPAEDQAAAARITPKRAIHVNLRDNSGAELSVGGGTQYAEDTAHVSGDMVTMAGVVRQDADAPLSANNARSVSQVDGQGFLKVNIKAGFTGLTDAELRASAVPVSISGSVAVTGPLTDAQLRATPVPVSGPLTDAQLRATAVPVSGPLTDAQLRATPVSVGDGGGSLTVDGPLTNTELRASAVPVTGPLTDAQLRATPVPVDQSNTADADYDTGGGTTNQAMMGLALPGAGGPVAGGTATNPVRVDPTGTTNQPISAASLPLPTGAATEATQAAQVTTTNFDSKIGILTEAAPASDTGSSGLNGRLQRIAQNITTLISRFPAALVSGRLDVNLGAAPATLTMPVDANATEVQGTAAHGTSDAQNPVKIGAVARTSLPTAVSAGQRVDQSNDVYGRPFTRIGHQAPAGNIWTAGHEPAANTRATATQAAAGAGIRNVCTALTVVLAAGATAPTAINLAVRVIDGASGGGTYVWRATISCPATAGATQGIALSGLWLPGTANTAMTIEFSAAGGANTVESVWMSGTVVAE